MFFYCLISLLMHLQLYITGGGETLNNYELHLKNRLHRRRVNDRILRGGSVTINGNDP